MTRRRSGQQGFTLVEIIAATAITGILIAIVMGFIVNSLVQISVEGARSDLIRENQISLDTITQDIRLSSNAYEANSIPDDNAPDDDNWQGGNTVLILATAALDDNKNIIFDDALHYTSVKNNKIYFVENGTLYRRTLAADTDDNTARTSCPAHAHTSDCPKDSELANNVSRFVVRYFDGNGDTVAPNDARSVEVELTLAVRKYGRDIETTNTTRTVFRNE